MHGCEREVLPVEVKRRRVDSEEGVLEIEDAIGPEVLRAFVQEMAEKGADRRSDAWKLLFDEFALDRLKASSPTGWLREMRRGRSSGEALRSRSQRED